MLTRIRVQRVTWMVVVYVTIHFLYSYWTHSYNPINRLGFDRGWYSCCDQLNYLQIARALAAGNLPRPMYYGPGYPLLAAPFVNLLSGDPFVMPDFVLYVCTIVICFRIARAFLSTELSLLAIVLLCQSDQFTLFFVAPWSNVVTVFCMALLLFLAITPPLRRRLAALVVGVCLGWTFAARYTDMILLLPIATLAIVSLAPTWKQRASLAGWAALSALPFVLWMAAMHQAAFGSPFITPYQLHFDPITGYSEQNLAGRSFSYFGYHLFSILINPHVLAMEPRFTPMLVSIADRALLSYYFVIVLSGVGLAFMRRQHHGLVWAFVLSLGMGLISTGTSWASSGDDLKFHALRFFSPWEPLLVISAVAGLIGLLRADWRAPPDRRLIVISLAATLVFGLGLYTLGRLLPPFPDTARLIPTHEWSLSASAALKHTAKLIDHNIITSWYPQRTLEAGAYIQIDLARSYQLEELFLARMVQSQSDVVSVGLETSLDGDVWGVPANLKINFPEERIMAFEFDPHVAHYVHLFLTEKSTEQGWEVGEIYAYGTLVTTP